MKAAILPSDTQLIQLDNNLAFRMVVSWTRGAFLARARQEGMTVESLSLKAQEYYLENAPVGLPMISDQPLVDRGCATCALEPYCESAKREHRDYCFL